jgi:hypothetical protein
VGLGLTNFIYVLNACEVAIADNTQAMGAKTNISLTMTPAKYTLVIPYITAKIFASVNFLKQK